MATYGNVYKLSGDVPETKHHGHEVDPGPLTVLDPDEPDVRGYEQARCLDCGETFLAFEDEIQTALRCDAHGECYNEVTMIDQHSALFCQYHGLQRRQWYKVRELEPAELDKLERDESVAY